MDPAYVRETPPPEKPYKVQETLHFRYLKVLLKEPGFWRVKFFKQYVHRSESRWRNSHKVAICKVSW